jgi:hypothetical protein
MGEPAFFISKKSVKNRGETNTICGKFWMLCLRQMSLEIFWLYIFWLAKVCWLLLCLCRPFCIFERCLDSNLESWRSKQVRYQLSHPSPKLSHPSPNNLSTHLPNLAIQQFSHPSPNKLATHLPTTLPPISLEIMQIVRQLQKWHFFGQRKLEDIN